MIIFTEHKPKTITGAPATISDGDMGTVATISGGNFTLDIGVPQVVNGFFIAGTGVSNLSLQGSVDNVNFTALFTGQGAGYQAFDNTIAYRYYTVTLTGDRVAEVYLLKRTLDLSDYQPRITFDVEDINIVRYGLYNGDIVDYRPEPQRQRTRMECEFRGLPQVYAELLRGLWIEKGEYLIMPSVAFMPDRAHRCRFEGDMNPQFEEGIPLSAVGYQVSVSFVEV